MVSRFHIAEWYGHPFFDLNDEKRLELADHKVGKSMPKSELQRLTILRRKLQTGDISKQEQNRLESLEKKLSEKLASEQRCPFRTDQLYPTCTKSGGVCSIRLVSDEDSAVQPVPGEKGMLRALCPYRFHQDNTVFKYIGKRLLGDSAPLQIGEVGFLESSGNLDSEAGEDVGRIDMILVSNDRHPDAPLAWTAVEIQAVYFSGAEMSSEFRHLKSTGGKATMPAEKRRPDYRSSGPKRLMPQLQIKVPTLRRWGKKMAVVVDKPFFLSMGKMSKVEYISNADIVWILVDFVKLPGQDTFELQVVDEIATTLESSIKGLTGGTPVSREEFEARILGKA